MKSPLSPTGNPNGFTILEVLLATVVFTTGVLFIFPSYFKCEELFSQLSARQDADLLAHDLLSAAERDLRAGSVAGGSENSGKLPFGGREFDYHRKVSPEDPLQTLYAAEVHVLWESAGKTREVTKRAYLLK